MLLAGLIVQAQNTIEITMTNFSSDEGKVKVGLYDKEGDFLDNTFMMVSSEITNKKASATFTEVPDGVYAVSVFHDEDDNGELNMILGMIPSESYGCSNDAQGFFGPPKWLDAKFEVTGGEVKKVPIKL